MSKNYLDYIGKPVSQIVFGTAGPPTMFGPSTSYPGMPKPSLDEAFSLLDGVKALGVNTIDCSAQYGEEVVGLWLDSRKNRDEMVILTKCAHPNAFRKRVTEHDILSDLADSLAKLKTDYIDIYVLHRDDPDVPVGEIVELMNRLHRSGVIHAFGGSNWTVERLAAANEYAGKHGLVPFTVSSPNFGLAEQQVDPWGGGCTTIAGPQCAADRRWYRENNMPVFAYSSLARGFFSGRFRHDEPGKAGEMLDYAGKSYINPENLERLRRCEILAEKKGYSIPQLALAWMFHQQLDVHALVAAPKAEYIKQDIDALSIPLSDDECRWLDLRED